MSATFVIAHESLRVETFRVWKLYRISVKRVGNNGDGRPSRNHVAIWESVSDSKEVQFYSKLNRKYAGDGYMNNAQQSKRKAKR
jgi:hypothetical protein